MIRVALTVLLIASLFGCNYQIQGERLIHQWRFVSSRGHTLTVADPSNVDLDGFVSAVNARLSVSLDTEAALRNAWKIEQPATMNAQHVEVRSGGAIQKPEPGGHTSFYVVVLEIHEEQPFPSGKKMVGRLVVELRERDDHLLEIQSEYSGVIPNRLVQRFGPFAEQISVEGLQQGMKILRMVAEEQGFPAGSFKVQ